MVSGGIEEEHCTGTRRGDSRGWLIPVALVLVFWPALLGDYVGDDHRLIANNVALREHDFAAMLTQPLFGIEVGYWRPVTVLGFWLGYTLAGAFGVHLLALLAHVAATFFVQKIAGRFVAPAMARWIALVFALHPVQVESLTWCAALNDGLWSLAALGAMLAAARWRDSRGWWALLAVGSWCLLALLAKETGAVAIPLALAAAAWLPGTSGAIPRFRWWPLLTLLTMVFAAWLAARAWVLSEPLGIVLSGLGENRCDFDPARATSILHGQLVLLVWPFPLIPLRIPAPVGAVVVSLMIALGIAACAAIWRRRTSSRWLFGLVVVLLPIAPVALHHETIGLYPIADRYLYLSVAGFALLVGSLPMPGPAWLRWILLGAMAVGSFRGSFLRQDDDTLAVHSLEYLPQDPAILVMAADARLGAAFDGDPFALLRCERLYRRALARIETADEREQRKRTRATAQLGLAWCRLLRWSAADRAEKPPASEVLDAFRAAIECDPRDPAAWAGLGVASGELGRIKAARAAFEHALELEPHNAAARRGLRRLESVPK
ncbi:MAG: hypothetical protein NXI31_00660 [bacterium]|nr:hypothetical protein [bacterium]